MRRTLVRWLLVGEGLLFVMGLWNGRTGICGIWRMSSEKQLIQIQNASLKNEIAQLTQEIEVWQTDSFYWEKAAREQLHMARSNESIYLIDDL